MQYFKVTRIVRETACVDAESKEEAIKKVTENGAFWDIDVIRESAKKVKTLRGDDVPEVGE